MAVWVDDARVYREIKGSTKRVYRGTFSNVFSDDYGEVQRMAVIVREAKTGVLLGRKHKPPLWWGIVTERARRKLIAAGAKPVAFDNPNWLLLFTGKLKSLDIPF